MTQHDQIPAVRWLSLGVASLLVCASGAQRAEAQDGLPYTIVPPEGSVEFGRAVASDGDVDGDGLPDIFVADPAYSNQNGIVGRWFVFSGADGSLVWSVTGEAAFGSASRRMTGAFIGDIDGDERDDLIVGLPAANGSAGLARVYSGRAGDLLYEFVGANADDQLGLEVRGIADVNGDLVPDFAYSASDTPSGYVSIRSGATGEELHRYTPATPVQPRRIRSAGDLNGDLVPDLIVSAIGGGSGGAYYGEVHAVSGATAEPLWIVEGRNSFGWGVATGLDLNGDTVADVLVWDSSALAVAALSGVSGDRIGQYPTPVPGEYWGSAMTLADVNADGRPDLIALRVTTNVYGVDAVDVTSWRVLHWVQGDAFEANFYYFGNEVTAADVNGDGADDFIIGSVGTGVRVFGGGRLLLNFAQRRSNYDITSGASYDFTVGGGRTGRVIHLLGSISGNGCTFIPQLGICIDLDQRLYRLGAATTGSDHTARFTVDIPTRIPRGHLWLQALDPRDPSRGPITSNVMQLDVVD